MDTYLAKRSQLSTISPMTWGAFLIIGSMTFGLALSHNSSSIGFWVMSFPGLLVAWPASELVALTDLIACRTGLGNLPSSGSPSLSLFSCIPRAREMIWRRLSTKFEASSSLASPSAFSGAPVMVSIEPSCPACGFCRPPVPMFTKARGAGGNRMLRALSDPTTTNSVPKANGMRRLTNHAKK
jgi:hypothetical protein